VLIIHVHFVRYCRTTAGVATLLLPILAAVGACRSSPSQADAGPVLRIAVGTGAARRTGLVSNFTELLFTEPLIGRQADGRPIPHLAASWHWQNGNQQVRVRIKQGIEFHNGKQLTAELVARALNQQVAAVRATAPQAYDTVLKIGSEGNDVVVDLARPDGLLVSELFGLRISDPDDPNVGTGPFRLVKMGPSPETIRYEKYHGGVSELAGVNIVTYDSQRSAWAALLRGEVDAVQEVNRDSVEFLEAGTSAATYSFLQPFYIPLVFNLKHGALRNVEVRRAITEALNREEIVARAMRGRGKVADGPIWPLHWAFSAVLERHDFAPGRAVARLTKAGFPLKVAEPGKPRSRLTFRCLFWSEDPQYERIALMIQRQLFEIGIDLKLEPATLIQFQQRAAAGDFDSFLIRTNASRSLDITYRFWRSAPPGSGAMQQSGYTGADDLLDALQRSTDDTEVRQAVEALSRRFYEDAPAAFIAWTEITRAISSRFVVPEAGGEDPFSKIWQWRPVRPGDPE
jgi:peptide/nickel transport system substrate-binding protein